MPFHTDGTRTNGQLVIGQVWVKGRTERVIVRFDREVMVYKSKKDFKEGTETVVGRNVFRRWLYSGAMLKVLDS